jgi:adenylate cyclase
MKRKFSVIIILFIFTVLLFFPIRFFDILDLKWWDFVQHSFPDKWSSKVFIVSIDDDALNEYGRWPFDRKVLSNLIDKISDHNPKLIGLDILFPERSNSDETFSSAIFYSGNVVGSVSVDEKQPVSKNNNELNFFPSFKGDAYFKIVSFLGNVESISDSFLSRGHIHILNDFDGTIRHYHPFFIYKERLIPGMAFELYRLYKGYELSTLKIMKNKILIGEDTIPIDHNRRNFIHFLKNSGDIPQIKMTDIMTDNVKYDLNNKIILVGVTATGAHDYRVSPISQSTPGVEIEATITNNYLTGNLIKPHRTVNYILIIFFMWILSIFYIFFNRKFNLARSLYSLLFLIFIFFSFHFLFFLHFKMVFHFLLPLLLYLFIFGYLLAYHYLVSSKGARKLKMILSHYLSPNIMSELLENPELVKLGGSKVNVSVLFGDVAGFTSFSENHSPEEVVTYLNEILTILTRSVFQYNGTLDKYIGDCIMAFWGAPLPDVNSAEHCVLAAINMIENINKFNETTQDKFYIGVGINSGAAVIGNMGSETVYDYTAMGDTVNTASRMEGVTRNLNKALVITRFTYNELPDYLMTRFEKYNEKVIVKGKEKGIEVYTLKDHPLKKKKVIRKKKRFEARG